LNVTPRLPDDASVFSRFLEGDDDPDLRELPEEEEEEEEEEETDALEGQPSHIRGRPLFRLFCSMMCVRC
jgi:CO dehydrogenase/acetyl-CoA synthase beta subunit